MTKRICRSLPFDEQAALAEVKTLTATVRKAANTVLQAGHLLRDLGHRREAARTIAAAAAIMATVDGDTPPDPPFDVLADRELGG